MKRSRFRIAVAVLVAALAAPALASAHSLGLSQTPGSVVQQAIDPLVRAWNWLTGIRPDAGCSIDPNGGNCLPAKARPAEGCSIDPMGGHCNPATTTKPGSGRPGRPGRTSGRSGSVSRHARTNGGCSSDPNGGCAGR